MLQSIRDKTQGIIATIIVGIVALTFAIWGIHYYLEDSKQSTVVIQLNSAKLMQNDFDHILRRNQRLAQLTRPDTPMSESIQEKMQQIAIDQWIETTLLTTAAKNVGFMVSPQMLQQTLVNLEMFQQNGQFSPALFQQRISAMGYTPEEFQKNLHGALLMDQLRYGLSNSDFSLPNELNHLISTLYQTRDIGYAIISSKSFMNTVVIQPAAIKKYYDSHQQDFMNPEKVKVEYLLIKFEDLKQRVAVSDADIKTYYQEHSDLQTKPLALVKNSIQERLENQNADKLMASLSDQLDSLSYEDPTNLQSVSQKLHIPTQVSTWLTRQDTGANAPFPSAVIDSAFRADVVQQGYNSPLITLNDGSVMVLRLKAHEASAAKPLQEVENQIKAVLTAEEIKKMAEEKGNALLKDLQQGLDPKTVSQKKALVWQEAFDVSRTSLGLNPELLAALFNIPIGHKSNQPLVSSKALSNGDYLVLQVKAIHAGLESASTDKDKKQLARQWAASLGENDYAFYTRGLRDKAKIKIHLPKNEATDEDGQ